MIRSLRTAPFLFVCAALLAGCSGASTPAVGADAARRPASGLAMAASATNGPATSPSHLSSYNVDSRKVFVAGISSGGFFGVQMHVAHSSTFKGAAIYAGGVYHCALDSVELALLDCGGETLPTGQASYHSTLAQSEQYLDQQSAAGTIDPSSNLAGKPVYLWSGTNDSVVNPLEMADLRAEYAHYGARITFDDAFPANHGWESPDGEVACGTASSPYMIVCNQGNDRYDSVKTWMTKFFGTLRGRNDGALKGTLLDFDQTEFRCERG